MYAVGYEVYHHPLFLLIGLHSVGCKRTLINFNPYNFNIHIQGPYLYGHVLFCTPFHKAKFCGVPSRATVKVGCAVVKNGWETLG
jgi:hypothetical protein